MHLFGFLEVFFEQLNEVGHDTLTISIKALQANPPKKPEGDRKIFLGQQHNSLELDF